MTETLLEIRPFDFAGASDHDYAALNRHFNRSKAERLPDDPPTPVEEMVAQMHNIPPFVSVQVWAGWDAEGAEIRASAELSFLKTEENTHLAQFSIDVEPEFRRRGLGRELLRRVAAVPRQEGRRLMMTDTTDRVPAGEAFLQRLGAERGLEMHTNQLVLAELDAALVGQWQAEGPARATGFALGFWDGPYPDDQLEAIVALNDVMNTAPRDSLDMEDMHFTAEQIRQMEQMHAAAGTQRWTLYAAEAATGRFAGFTEVHWNPNRPEIVGQGGTGVFPEFRGKGLGRWLKAAMLDKIARDRPEAKFVRTGNADSNAAMLGINQALGFQPYMSRCVWQLETDKALAYLGKTMTDKTPLTLPDYDLVLADVAALLDTARRAAVRSVNAVMTTTYWQIGRRLVEVEQGGEAKADYGDNLIERLAQDLTLRFGRGFGRRNLFQMRAFYLAYPQKVQTVSAQLENLFSLPWSHYVKLLSVRSDAARAFYETEALRGGWSLRQLHRQINSQFYERTALSKNKAAMLTQGSVPKPADATTPEEEIKDPLVLEFLALKDEYSESQLEDALIHHLEDFLLELGSDFTFVGRQRRLRIGNQWFRVDLLFFHRALRCLVIIDLKLGEFTHADVGQMHLYLNYAREHWTRADENPPVGLILCEQKDAAVAHYALDGLPNTILAAEYRAALPDEAALTDELARTRRLLETRASVGE